MEDFDGTKVFAEYSSFNVSGEKDGYRLTLSGFKDGGAGETKQGLAVTQVTQSVVTLQSIRITKHDIPFHYFQEIR